MSYGNTDISVRQQVNIQFNILIKKTHGVQNGPFEASKVTVHDGYKQVDPGFIFVVPGTNITQGYVTTKTLMHKPAL